MGALKTVVIVGGVGVILYMGARSMMPLGIRNNNPLNIRYNSANKWDGMTGENNGFCTFSSSKYGLRAGAKLLRNYMVNNELRSVAGIIKKWSPSHENPTDSYIDYVAKAVGVNAADNTLTEKHIPLLLKAMIKFENGINPYSDNAIVEGCQLAGVKLS
ncbi:structural protein P5 [Vibrio sp. VNB-15]